MLDLNDKCVDLLDVRPGFKPQVRLLQQNEIRKHISQATCSQQTYRKSSERKNKIFMKKFHKNLLLGVDFKLQIPPVMYTIKAHNISGLRN